MDLVRLYPGTPRIALIFPCGRPGQGGLCGEAQTPSFKPANDAPELIVLFGVAQMQEYSSTIRSAGTTPASRREKA